MSKKTRTFRSLFTVLLLVFIVGNFWYFDSLYRNNLDQPQSWEGITPGETTLPVVLTLLGQPEKIEYREKYIIYSYLDEEKWGWEIVEVWALASDEKQAVIGVYRFSPDYSDRYEESNSYIYLEDVILNLGRPEKVTWTSGCRVRALVWAKKGIMIIAEANTKLKSWGELSVDDVLFFVPMSTAEFLSVVQTLPWKFGNGILDKNVCTSSSGLSHFPDTYPEDPYDWSGIFIHPSP